MLAPTKAKEQARVVPSTAGPDPLRSSELVLRPASLKALESLVDEIFFELIAPQDWGPLADDWFALLEERKLRHSERLPKEPAARGASRAAHISNAPRNDLDFALTLFAENLEALATHRVNYGEEVVLAYIAFVDGFNAGRADSLVLLLTRAYSALLKRYTRARDDAREKTAKLEDADRFQQEATAELDARRRQKAALDKGGRANGAAENRKRKAAHEAVISRLYAQCIEENPNWNRCSVVGVSAITRGPS